MRNKSATLSLQYQTLEDGTIVDSQGRIILFSEARFMNDIVEGNCCFICGLNSDEKDFNREHVIPDWILRKYELQNKLITLPNIESVEYSKYKVPCCYECNRNLGKLVEEPIHKIISDGYEGLVEHIRHFGLELIFKWLNLLFFKIHFKDRELRIILDRRKPDDKIGDLHNWKILFDIHTIARSMYSNSLIDPKIVGTTLIFKMDSGIEEDQFDIGVNETGSGILLKLGDILIISILNDCCCSMKYFDKKFEKIDGIYNVLQSREILCELSLLNKNLFYRPIFYSEFGSDYRIKAKIPAGNKLVSFEPKEFGESMYRAFHDIIRNSNLEDPEELLLRVKDGKISFLFDENGNFKGNSIN